MPTPITAFHAVLEVLISHLARKKNQRYELERRKSSYSYLQGNQTSALKKTTETEFGKVAGYKINMQKALPLDTKTIPLVERTC